MSERRPVGRPPRISRQAIAEAALDVGLEDLTLKAVADHLGVSVPGLYHHVKGRDDLLRLAAEHSVARRHVPVDRGQHWAVWLLEWARYNRDAFLAEPGLLTQYVEGAISPEAILANAEAILDLLCRQGFDAVDAQAAYELVSSCAIGFAVTALRAQRATDEGRSLLPDLLDEQAPGSLPHLRAVVAARRRDEAPDFDAEIATVLRGVAAQRGERWAAIARHLAAASG